MRKKKKPSKNFREVMIITPRSFIDFLGDKYDCSVSVQIREVSRLGKTIRKELCKYHNIRNIYGWGIDKNGWKHSKKAKGIV